MQACGHKERIMGKKNSLPVLIGIIFVLLITACIGMNVYDLINMFPFEGAEMIAFAVLAVLLILGLVSALIYFFAGYKKDASKYFKGYVYLYALTALETCLLMDMLPVVSKLSIVLKFGILCVLSAGNDLGKKKSYILCALNFVLTFVNLFACGLSFVYSSRTVSTVFMAIFLWIMVAGKYSDKTSRGTK